ncbi:MAG: maleylpyruvate isomerase N-terminal domain-containing protein [Acidimicrobiales bacterium]
MSAEQPQVEHDGVLRRIEERTGEIVTALRSASASLGGPSSLPGWSRRTIVCHLRFGAEASLRVTSDALAGIPTSFYPGGRDVERPATLEIRPGEDDGALLRSLEEASRALHHCWAATESPWHIRVLEDVRVRRLGDLVLRDYQILRLTEVEVHGTDLDLGLSDWSDLFVRTALPWRLGRLAAGIGVRLDGMPDTGFACCFRTTDGAAYEVVASSGGIVAGSLDRQPAERSPASPGPAGDAPLSRPGMIIVGSERDTLAVLLGRRPVVPLRTTGDAEALRLFKAHCPGP